MHAKPSKESRHPVRCSNCTSVFAYWERSSLVVRRGGFEVLVGNDFSATFRCYRSNCGAIMMVQAKDKPE